MTAYQRIECFLKHYKISARQAASRLELKSPQIFYDIKSGKCGVSKSLAEKIQDKFFNISAAWLLTGEGTMLREDQSKIDIKLERVQAGDDNTYIEGCSDSALAAKLREAQREIEHLKDKIKDRDARISELKTCNEFLMAQANK